MQLIRNQILVLLSLLVLLPSVVLFAHIFSQHEHNVCSEQQTHFHAQNVDCDILNYKPTPSFSLEVKAFDVLEIIYQLPSYPETYQFLSDYQKLAFSLRGPPPSDNWRA